MTSQNTQGGLPAGGAPTEKVNGGHQASATAPGASEKPSNSGKTRTGKDEVTSVKPETPKSGKASIADKLKEAVTPPEWVLTNSKVLKNWKIVLRCAVASWAGLILILVRPSEQMLGNAAFLVLIVSFIMPPSNPIASSIEQYIVATFFIAFAWAYSCFWIWLAYLARSRFSYPNSAAFGAAQAPRFAAQGVPAAQISSAVQLSIFNADYVEAASSIVLAFGFGIYVAIALFVRTWIGPSPYLFGVILSIICATICLLYHPLFPYPYYALGMTFFRPYICQIAINLACAVLIFPESLHDQFLNRLKGVLVSLQGILADQENLLSTDPTTSEWSTYKRHKVQLAGASKALGMLGMSESLLQRNVTVQRASAKDLQELLTCIRALTGRTSGFTYFQNFVQRHISPVTEGTDEELIIHFGRSRPATPHTSHPPSPLADTSQDADPLKTHSHHQNSQSHSNLFKHIFSHNHQHRPSSGSHKHSRPSSTHEGPSSPHHYGRVGFIESQAYMLIEDRMGHHDDLSYLPDLMSTLRTSSSHILKQLDESMDFILQSLDRLQTRSLLQLIRGGAKDSKQDVEKAVDEEVSKLREAINKYENTERIEVVQAFVHLFDPNASEIREMPFLSKTSHRGLYLAFTYQWSVLQYAKAALRLLESITTIRKKRRRIRLFAPPLGKLREYFRSTGEQSGIIDEDPDAIDGLSVRDAPISRDPDFKSPTTRSQKMAKPIVHALQAFGKPNMLFAYKAGVLGTLAAFPAFFHSTADFYYKNRGLWVTIMVVLTSNRFVGDTVYQFVLRVGGTFIGAVGGMTVWYIGNGSGLSAYGTAAVCAVVFPLMQFYRVFCPIIVQGILTNVTAILVIGYSWQDATLPTAGAVGQGWSVAWRRFLAVLIGISIAFIGAFLPPKSTQKTTIRRTYAATLDANVSILFRIISLNVGKKQPIQRLPNSVIKNITATRARLLSSALARNMIKYEFDFRGAWPAAEYEALANLQVELVDLIGQFGTALATLEPAWTRALLHRTHLDDPDFLAHISSTMSLVTSALRTKTPMPFYNRPLLATFLKTPYRFRVTFERHDPDLPATVDYATITSSQYMRFSCCVSLAYSVINRIDRIVQVVKQLTGEQLYVRGLGDMSHLGESEPGNESDESDGEDVPLRRKTEA